MHLMTLGKSHLTSHEKESLLKNVYFHHFRGVSPEVMNETAGLPLKKKSG